MKVKNGQFRVVYGEVSTRSKDFPGGFAAVQFVRSLLSRHPDWSLGDSWRDEIYVVEFVDVGGVLEPRSRAAWVSQFVF